MRRSHYGAKKEAGSQERPGLNSRYAKDLKGLVQGATHLFLSALTRDQSPGRDHGSRVYQLSTTWRRGGGSSRGSRGGSRSGIRSRSATAATTAGRGTTVTTAAAATTVAATMATVATIATVATTSVATVATTSVATVARRAAVTRATAATTGNRRLLAAHQGQADDREKDRDAQN